MKFTNVVRLVVVFITHILVQCKPPDNIKYFQRESLEGYVILTNKVFQDVDSVGMPISELSGGDSILFSISRKIFIYGHYLIDIKENSNFLDGEYIKSDTVGYVFYDLNKQKFIKFEKLFKDSKSLSNGEMINDGFFSNEVKYDFMSGISDSAWKIVEIITNGKRNLVVEFLSLNIADSALSRRAKIWIDPSIQNFPIQMSHLLSKKNNNAFVYKRQLPMADEKSVMVTSFEYIQTKLPDSLISIFKSWGEVLDDTSKTLKMKN